MKKLIIFDLDGTLLDTIEDLANCVNYALEKCGYPTHEILAYRYFVGRGVRRLLYTALPEGDATDENVEKLREYFIPQYAKYGSDLTKPYPGVVDLLEKLQQDGVMLAVASNKYHEATTKMVTQFFPQIDFCAVFGQRDEVPAKPDPQVVNDILELTRVPRNEVLYVGDSGVDMETASNACVASVGVSWGFRPVSELQEFGADVIIDRADTILELLHL